MKWFDNPRRRRKPSKRRKSKRRPPKGFRSWKAYMASIRPKAKGTKHMARKRRRSRGSRRRTRRSHRRRARAVSITLRNRPRRRRSRGVRRYRRMRNPGRSVGSISPRAVISRAIQGAKDGLYVVGGKVITNALPSLLGLSPTGALGIGMKALSAVAAGYVFDFVLGRDAGKIATASGFATIYEPFLKGFNIPIVSPALAADDYDYGSLAAYPDEVGSLSAYPSVAAPVGVGSDDDDFAQQY